MCAQNFGTHLWSVMSVFKTCQGRYTLIPLKKAQRVKVRQMFLFDRDNMKRFSQLHSQLQLFTLLTFWTTLIISISDGSRSLFLNSGPGFGVSHYYLSFLYAMRIKQLDQCDPTSCEKRIKSAQTVFPYCVTSLASIRWCLFEKWSS